MKWQAVRDSLSKKSPAEAGPIKRAILLPPMSGLTFRLAPSVSLFWGDAAPSPRLLQGYLRQARQGMSQCWRVVLLHAKGDILGTVEAPDAEAAKTAARFSLN